MLFMLFVRVSLSLYMHMTFPIRSWSKHWKNSHSHWCCPYPWSPTCLAAGGQGKTLPCVGPGSWCNLLFEHRSWDEFGGDRFGLWRRVLGIACSQPAPPSHHCQSPDHWKCKRKSFTTMLGYFLLLCRLWRHLLQSFLALGNPII